MQLDPSKGDAGGHAARLGVGYGDIVLGEWTYGRLPAGISVFGARGDASLAIKKLLVIDSHSSSTSHNYECEVYAISAIVSKTDRLGRTKRLLDKVVWDGKNYSSLIDARKRRAIRMFEFFEEINLPEQDLVRGWTSVKNERPFWMTVNQMRIYMCRNPSGPASAIIKPTEEQKDLISRFQALHANGPSARDIAIAARKAMPEDAAEKKGSRMSEIMKRLTRWARS